MNKLENTTKLKHWTLAINEIIDEVNNVNANKADNSGVVHNTGDENVDGTKTFSDSIVVSANPLIQSSPWSAVSIADETRQTAYNLMLCTVNDKNGKRAGGLEISANTDGSRHLHYTMRNRADTDWISSFQMKENADGTVVSTVPNPDDNASANEVATASWVLGKISATNPTKVSELTNDLDFQTKTEVDSAISKLVGSAPETLDTLNELATALGNDPNFATTVANQIGTKANDADVVKLSGTQTIAGAKTFSSTITGSVSGNAGTATKLATARTIGLSGAVTGTATSFDGSKNITISTTALDVSKATTGTLSVAHGGTGRTDGYAVNVTEHIGLKSRDNIGYVSSSDASSNDVADRETLAWWNGAYSDNNSSNLTYCANGTIVGTTGNQTIGGTKTFSSTISGSISGNAATATTATKANQLTTARTIAIGGVVTGTATSFNGTANITIDTTSLNLEDGGISGELPIAHGGTGRTDGKAAGLATARTIDGVSFNGSANISHFGTCSTAAATAAKVVSCSGFTLATGARIIVQFTVTNTASSPTLNVNSTGAKAIVYRNAAITASNLAANRVYEFVYDGTNYELIGDINTDTNTDTKVTQTVTTTNASYALLATATASPTATKTEGARFCSGITINPSTKSLTAAGTITGSAVYNAVWNDYAEFFPRGEETEPGDIIMLDLDSDEEVYVKAHGKNARVVGVHSDTYGHLIGGEKNPDGTDFVEYNIAKFIPVGLAGRVKTKCTGNIKKGDYIVLSDISGVGRAYNESTDTILDIIGIACETKNCEENIQRILMKVKS